jgi:beta-glucoside operon transcriptional antiterminator
VLEFAAQLADLARSGLSYELSPNLPVTLADHIAFAIKRAEEHMVVEMPLAFDVQQSYPAEYRIGEMAVHGIERTFSVHLPRTEAVGIALSIVNSAISASAHDTERQQMTERLIEGSTKIVESRLGIEVERDSFDYARFATHMRYLIGRLASGEHASSGAAALSAGASGALSGSVFLRQRRRRLSRTQPFEDARRRGTGLSDPPCEPRL